MSSDKAVSAAARAQARRRAKRRGRRLLGALVVGAPALVIVVSDFVRRGSRIVAFDSTHRLGYAASAFASFVFWGVLLAASSRRRGVPRQWVAGLFAVLYTLVLVVEGVFYRTYNIYLSVDSQLAFQSLAPAPTGALNLRSTAFWAGLAVSAGLALGLLTLARRFVRLRPWPRRLAPLLVPFALLGIAFVPSSYRRIQASTYDILYFDGIDELARLLREKPVKHQPGPFIQPRRVPAIPAIATKPSRPRNVLFVLEESIRHDAVCVAYAPDCKAPGRHTNEPTKGRIPLLQMRAVATSTAVSEGVLFSGMSPTASDEELHRAPFVFSYAKAAGYATAYWTGQNVITWGTRFFTQDEPIDSRAYATNIDSEASTDHGASDRDTSRYAIEHLGDLREPYFAVVHYASAHRPYYVERALSPYRDGDGSRMSARYRNAVNLSDLAVADFIRAVRASPAGDRTVIVYTSDHGECFNEDGYTGHGLGLGESELRVPAWIDAPKGTLSEDEEKHLREAKDAFAWHPDLAATLLDLLGVWDAPEVAPYRAAMLGHPLTRGELTTEPLPLTTTNAFFRYHEHNSYGMMQGSKKIWAKYGDKQQGFRCYDLATDPDEQHVLPEGECGGLAARARAIFGGTPREAPGYPTAKR